MVHKVGIVGVTGNIGAPTTKALSAAAEQGKIELVIFHRASTNLSAFAAGPNIEFRILNFTDPLETIEAAVAGVNVFISAVGFEGIPTESSVVEALAKSPDIVTYIPSMFSTTWDQSDYDDELLGPILKWLHQAWDRAREVGIGVTPVYCGVFDIYWFELDFIGAEIKKNVILANEKQMKNRFPISAADHLAQAITRIATADPHTVKNKEFSVVTFWPSGEELVELYTKVNGQRPQVKDWTPEDREVMRHGQGGFGAASVGYLDKWAGKKWYYEDDGRILDKDYEGPDFEELARWYANK